LLLSGKLNGKETVDIADTASKLHQDITDRIGKYSSAKRSEASAREASKQADFVKKNFGGGSSVDQHDKQVKAYAKATGGKIPKDVQARDAAKKEENRIAKYGKYGTAPTKAEKKAATTRAKFDRYDMPKRNNKLQTLEQAGLLNRYLVIKSIKKK